MQIKPDMELIKNATETLRGLSDSERRYILARVDAKTNVQALRECGLSQSWLTKTGVDRLNAIADKLRNDISGRAIVLLEGALPEAVMVLIDGLYSDDERIKQSAAKDILDRVMGRATQKTEVTGAMANVDISADSQHDKVKASIMAKLNRLADG